MHNLLFALVLIGAQQVADDTSDIRLVIDEVDHIEKHFLFSPPPDNRWQVVFFDRSKQGREIVDYRFMCSMDGSQFVLIPWHDRPACIFFDCNDKVLRIVHYRKFKIYEESCDIEKRRDKLRPAWKRRLLTKPPNN